MKRFNFFLKTVIVLSVLKGSLLEELDCALIKKYEKDGVLIDCQPETGDNPARYVSTVKITSEKVSNQTIGNITLINKLDVKQNTLSCIQIEVSFNNYQSATMECAQDQNEESINKFIVNNVSKLLDETFKEIKLRTGLIDSEHMVKPKMIYDYFSKIEFGDDIIIKASNPNSLYKVKVDTNFKDFEELDGAFFRFYIDKTDEKDNTEFSSLYSFEVAVFNSSAHNLKLEIKSATQKDEILMDKYFNSSETADDYIKNKYADELSEIFRKILRHNDEHPVAPKVQEQFNIGDKQMNNPPLTPSNFDALSLPLVIRELEQILSARSNQPESVNNGNFMDLVAVTCGSPPILRKGILGDIANKNLSSVNTRSVFIAEADADDSAILSIDPNNEVETDGQKTEAEIAFITQYSKDIMEQNTNKVKLAFAEPLNNKQRHLVFMELYEMKGDPFASLNLKIHTVNLFSEYLIPWESLLAFRESLNAIFAKFFMHYKNSSNNEDKGVKITLDIVVDRITDKLKTKIVKNYAKKPDLSFCIAKVENRDKENITSVQIYIKRIDSTTKEKLCENVRKEADPQILIKEHYKRFVSLSRNQHDGRDMISMAFSNQSLLSDAPSSGLNQNLTKTISTSYDFFESSNEDKVNHTFEIIDGILGSSKIGEKNHKLIRKLHASDNLKKQQHIVFARYVEKSYDNEGNWNRKTEELTVDNVISV